MQLIPGGPDIPDALLQAHEEGRVVFFCGAGISYAAGLPGFKCLVEKLMDLVGDPAIKTERCLIRGEQFDRVLGLYEQRIQGGRQNVRRHLPEVLTPDLSKPGALTTHFALLQLARRRSGGMKLVTTNFDRLFEDAAAAYKTPSFVVHPDTPARANWDGLVHLHGRLPEKPSSDDLERLIVSEADFGQAYLTQGWAAKFVATLFRDHVLCFVGYSVNDPVLRYMTAAQSLEPTVPLYAFAPDEKNNEALTAKSWHDKHVTPIVYDTADGHKALHQTLESWATMYRHGVPGKERLVAQYAHRTPSQAQPGDDFVGRVMWTLSDPSGVPAKRFAELDPAPPLDWLLNAFDADDRGQAQPSRSARPARATVDGGANHLLPLSFSARPPGLGLVSHTPPPPFQDEVLHHIGLWLLRHLNDPQLVLWIAQRGGQLAPWWAWRINYELNRLDKLAQDGHTDELENIRRNAPHAIPAPAMRTLWRLVLAGLLKAPGEGADLHQWLKQLKQGGVTLPLKRQLRQTLAPCVRLFPPTHFEKTTAPATSSTKIRQLVNPSVELAADQVHSILQDLDGPAWQAALPALLDDFQQLLRDALDLFSELGEAHALFDLSTQELPSIRTRSDNRVFRDWVCLIELLRDAWLATRQHNAARATRIAQDWFEQPYPVFKRLALFAASQDGCIAPQEWAAWLLHDEAECLWSPHTEREACELLLAQSPNLPPETLAVLEAAVLAGPPPTWFSSGQTPERMQLVVDLTIGPRLAKLKAAGPVLSTEGAERLAEIASRQPNAPLTSHERKALWHSTAHNKGPIPRKRHELREWIRQYDPGRVPSYDEGWRDVCQTRFFHTLGALCDLGEQSEWPRGHWKVALQIWSEQALTDRAWRIATSAIQQLPDEVVTFAAHEFSGWLLAASQRVPPEDPVFWGMCQRILALPLAAEAGIRTLEGGSINQPVTDARHHPVGRVTEAILNIWDRQNPQNGERLPASIRRVFSELCDPQVARFQHGRVRLAMRLADLFCVDEAWTSECLLPHFDWPTNPPVAQGVWAGFIASHSSTAPLLSALKTQFLATARHYEELGDQAHDFVGLLTRAALSRLDGFTASEWHRALSDLPPVGLQTAAQTVFHLQQQQPPAQRAAHWRNAVLPFWKEMWPKSRELNTPAIADWLAQLVLLSGEHFPEAMRDIGPWLTPPARSNHLVTRLKESGHCTTFPSEALPLLAKVVNEDNYPSPDLGECLGQIADADPGLSTDPQFMRLQTHVRQRS